MDFRIIMAITVTLIFWASAFAGIRAGLKAYSPGNLVLFRFLTASLVLLVYAMVTRMPLPDKKDLPAIFFLGFVGITVYHLALTFGELKVTAGSASLLIASAPIFTAILAMFILKEKIKSWGWIGIIISFLGISLVASGEGKGIVFEPAAFLILLAAISTSFYFVLQKPYLKKYSPLKFVTYAIWSGTFFQIFFSRGLFQNIKDAPIEATLAIIYLGIFPAALAYITWTYVLSRIPASLAASYLYLSPVLAIIIAWVWLGEMPAFLALVGGALTLLGVIVVNLWGR
ncbi:MAG: DMT family transporter [Candidatus Caldatribacteriota bacterium]|nr:DMT family transporter [Candidatus Caldatribacteriota bacterium]